jgi:hypothetical protein
MLSLSSLPRAVMLKTAQKRTVLFETDRRLEVKATAAPRAHQTIDSNASDVLFGGEFTF